MKRILMPVLLIFSAAGVALRFMQLKTAYTPDGLEIPGNIYVKLFYALTIAAAAAFILISRSFSHRHGRPPSAVLSIGGGFQPTVRVVSALTVAVSGGLYAFLSDGGLGFLETVVLAFSIFCCAAMVLFTAGQKRGRIHPEHEFFVLVPVFYSCFFLIILYKENAVDPTISDYAIELIGAIFIMLGLFYFAGFLYDKHRPRLCMALSMLAVFFSASAGFGTLGFYLCTADAFSFLTALPAGLYLIAMSLTLSANAALLSRRR